MTTFYAVSWTSNKFNWMDLLQKQIILISRTATKSRVFSLNAQYNQRDLNATAD